METSQNNIPYITLNSGHKMPAVGLGTFLSSEGDVGDVVKAAIIDNGYRHIDTASAYENEEAIGKALKEVFDTGIKREDVFVVTKIWHNEKANVREAL